MGRGDREASGAGAEQSGAQAAEIFNVMDEAMTVSKVERVSNLAAMVGIAIAEAEAGEVADRLDSLLRELEKLQQLDLSVIEPVYVFPDEAADEA